MPKPRKSLICLEATRYYHCISRCVRRAFLCGEDACSVRSFAHRRDWIEERLLELAQVFAIEVCGFGIVAKHSHAVLRVDQPLAESWNFREVTARGHQLSPARSCHSAICEKNRCSRLSTKTIKSWPRADASGSPRGVFEDTHPSLDILPLAPTVEERTGNYGDITEPRPCPSHGNR